MVFQLSEKTPLSEESDSNLLLMAAAGNETEQDRAATEFYHRYHPFVYEHCKNYSYSLGEKGVEDLVLMTMQRAFEKWETYRESESLDKKIVQARTVCWLCSIADNLFRDSFKTATTSHLRLLTIPTSDTDDRGSIQFEQIDEIESTKYEDPAALAVFDGESSEEENEGAANCECRDCLEQAMQELSDHEREILHLSAPYWTLEKEIRIPREILDEYCLSTKTTKENVRTIRRRTKMKIQQYASKHCPSCLKL